MKELLTTAAQTKLQSEHTMDIIVINGYMKTPTPDSVKSFVHGYIKESHPEVISQLVKQAQAIRVDWDD